MVQSEMLGHVRQEWRRVTRTNDVKETTPKLRDSVYSGSANRVSAKAQLYQLCTREHWRQPVYECFKDEGPPHRKQFTFKVIVNFGGALTTILECFGNPRTSKKAASNDAAEGALWGLKQMGYQL